MSNLRLIVLSSTKRQLENQKLLPALERYRGLYPTLIKSMRKNGRFHKEFDVVFVTAFGVFKADDLIPHRDVHITLYVAESLKKQNLGDMQRILRHKKYDEIYVNLSKSYLKTIEGFERFTNARIVYAKGLMGQKAGHMKNWIST